MISPCEDRSAGHTGREFELACENNQLKIKLQLAYDKIEELQSALLSRWNDATDCPPDSDKEVLLCSDEFGCIVGKMSFVVEKCHLKVTHWQPLPPLPPNKQK